MQSTLTTPAASSPALKSDERAGKYLTFMIGKEEFGVGVLKAILRVIEFSRGWKTRHLLWP